MQLSKYEDIKVNQFYIISFLQLFMLTIHTSTSCVCPIYVCNGYSLSVDHNLAVRSREPVAKYEPFGLSATHQIG